MTQYVKIQTEVVDKVSLVVLIISLIGLALGLISLFVSFSFFTVPAIVGGITGFFLSYKDLVQTVAHEAPVYEHPTVNEKETVV